MIKYIIFSILFVILVVIIFIAVSDIRFRKIKNVTYTIESEKIKKSVKAVFVSDFHNCGDIGEIVKRIENISPDVVFLGGDLVDRIGGCQQGYQLANILVRKYNCYFAPGNHEYGLKNPEEVLSDLQKIGVKVLEDKVEKVTINGNKIDICGVYDGVKLSENSMATQLKNVNYNSDKENYRILLAHFPVYAKSYFRYKFDLILSGHEHGGMISLPHKDKGLIGHKGFFPTFSGGEYVKENSVLIVSRGISYPKYNYILPRLFNNPELVVINIKGLNKENGQNSN